MFRLTSQEKLRLSDVAIGAVSQGVVITGADRRIISVNRAFETMTGFKEGDVLGRRCDFLQGPLTDAQAIVRMRVTLNAGLEFSGEVCNYRKDGQTFWNELTITPACDAEGSITHFVGVCRDISERVHARKALVEREKLAQQKSDQLQMVLGSMSQGISSFDREGRLTVWNARYAELFGMDPNELKAGTRFVDLLECQKAKGAFEGDPQTLQAEILQQVSSGIDLRVTYRIESGRVISSMRSPGPNGGWVSTHEDITDQHKKSESLAKATLQLTTALASMHQGLAMFDVEQKIVVWNRRYVELLRLPDDFLKAGTPLREILAERVRAGSFYGDIERALAREAEVVDTTRSFEDIDVTADGCFLLALVKKLDDGGYVVTHEDVTDKRRIEAQIEHDALHDALTGLPNRRYLDRVLAERQAACLGSGEGMAVLHVDLDRFKQINDTIGHLAGDAMLIHAASILRSSLPSSDFVSRVGGDEFVIVCTLGKKRRNLAALATRIVTQMRKPVMYENHECRVGVSIGVAQQTGREIDAKKLLIDADIALYQAKIYGRGSYQFFTPAMHSAVTLSKHVGDEILLGLERNEFVAYYQPQVDARTREISGLEALVRWEHPGRGLLSPDKFLTIADEMGVLGAIDRVILEQTLDNFDRWRAAGLNIPRASVNVSAKRLRDANLIKSLKRLAILPGTISFELLESIYLDEADDLVAWNIDQIRELGINIEIDDFGTGHTSILSLLKLKPDRLKIDRQLVGPIIGSDAQKHLLRTVVEIGHSLGIKVIAEGVETLEHAAIAQSLGCDELQGYAFSKPMSGQDFAVFAAESLRSNSHTKPVRAGI